MLAVFLSLLVVFVILVLSEVLWNKKKLTGELDRKFVHITVGSFVAFWPFYMSFRAIQLISLAFLAVVIMARYLKVFSAVHVSNRKTWGDFMFAIGIGLAATLTKSDWIFMAAILNMSLADGLAAIIGRRYGKKNQYKVLGNTKSVVGTLVFIEISLLIIGLTILLGPFATANPWALLIFLPLATAAVENFGIYGLDNVLVPVLITLVLERFLA